MGTQQQNEQVPAPARDAVRQEQPGPYAAAAATATLRSVPVWVEGPAAVDGGETLTAGEVLCPGWSLTSASREFAALMCRDGNLVVQRCRDHAVVWEAGTGGNAGAFLEMRDDGDLCVFTLTGAKEWSSGTGGEPGAFAQLGDDGVLVVFSFYRERLWSTPTRPGRGSSTASRTTR